jgi:hypothetical protein
MDDEATPAQETPAAPTEPSDFERVMADIEGNDDMDTKMIMEQTGAKEVKPEDGPPPGSKPDESDHATPEGEQEAKPDDDEEKKPDEEPKDDDKPTEPPPSDGDARLAKLRAQGRKVGDGRYQVSQGMAELKQKQAEFAAEQAQAQQLAHEATTMIENFKRDPIGTAKAYGVDPRAMGQQIKAALANPEAARASVETTEMAARLDRIEQLLTTKNEQQTAAEQERAYAEAVERDHQAMKTYMSDDAAKKAYPLTARLPEDVFRQESARAARWLLQEGLDVVQDNVCEVIESNLEKLRSVYTDTTVPTNEKRTEPAAGSESPAGQRAAPSLGADEKTSGNAGTDWDTMSLGDVDSPDFLEELKREVASG